MNMFSKLKKGFTLVELVVVIAVIAILASVSVGAYFGVVESSKDSAAIQEATIAYKEYLVSRNQNNKLNESYFYKFEETRIVHLKNGIADQIYKNEQEMFRLLFDDSTTSFVNEAKGYSLKPTVQSKLYEARSSEVYITKDQLNLTQGGVNATNGQINTTFTNNLYANIVIPNGAEKVSFLYFKTGGTWGSAFFDKDTYISGYYNKAEGGKWITIDIPTNASILKYGYLTDIIASQNNYPLFEYLEFSGENISHLESNPNNEGKRSVVKNTFSVEVDISSALNKKEYVKGIDYGYIILPENYTEDKEPTRLIITCHGAGANLNDYKSTVINKNISTYYWVEMGYAIMDMFACPQELGQGSELHYGNPTVLECYEKGYQYVINKFNLRTDGVFILGSSMGGLSSFQIVQSLKFPVLAQVGNCPVIDLYKQAYCNPWTTITYQRDRISSYFGFEGIKPIFTNNKPVPSNDEVEYFKNNFNKVKEHSPIFKNIISGNCESIFDVTPPSISLMDADEEVLYSQLTATHPVPLLLIHNKNDQTVSYRYTEYFYNMIKRGNPSLDLRIKLYETGGHSAWNNGPESTILNYKGEPILLSESKRMAIDFFEIYNK